METHWAGHWPNRDDRRRKQPAADVPGLYLKAQGSKPLHIISLGASGTGKTYLQEKVSELIPEQGKLEITILSEKRFLLF